MNVLITGVHGFVGSNLVRAFAGKYKIYGLDIVSPEKIGIEKTFGWEDLNVEGAIPPIDVIIHLAGKAHDTRNKNASDGYFSVNTDLTQRIFDWYLDHSSVKRFIFFSTVKSVADSVDMGILTEECESNPVGPYGESKMMAENYIIKKFAPEAIGRVSHNFSDVDSVLEHNRKIYILRPCMIHGPGNKGNLNLLYTVVKKGFPWPLGAFDNRRSFTSIENLCMVVDGLLTKSIESGIYNICDDEALSTNELIEIICHVLGKKIRIWHVPKSLINMVAIIGGWLHLPLDPLRMQKLTGNYVVSNAKIKHVLGIDKMPISARDGLMTTIFSFSQQK